MRPCSWSRRSLAVALATSLGLLGCHPDDAPSDRQPPPVETGPPVDSTTDASTDSGLPAPEWPFPLPWLEGVEWVPGKEAQLFLANLPPRARVTFRMSEAGLTRGVCRDPGLNGCPELIAPVDLLTTTADDDGYAQWSAPVESMGTTPRVLYFQAHVTDPVNGLSTLSAAIQRHVNVPATEALVHLENVTPFIGVGDTFCTGNSHTGGVAWPDYNGDHFPDLFVANGSGVPHRLFRNNGDGTFTEVSNLVPKASPTLETAAVHFADIDRDGDVDLFAVVDSAVQMNSESIQPLEGGPNLLYVNQGDGTFREEAAQRGLVDPRGWRNITAAWADFDGDGDVDVHLGTWGMNQTGVSRDDRLLLNDGTGHFTDSGQVAGHGRDTLTSLAADLDQDGLPDLYLGHVNRISGFNHFNPDADDVLLMNSMGTLLDVTASSPGLGDDAWAAMGLDVGDIDNDGDFDLYETDRWEVDDTLPRGNSFYLQNDDGTFTDNVCDLAGVCTSYAGWPTLFADFDRDGWVDLFVGTGKEYYPDLVYINDRDGTFTSHWVPSLQESPVRGGAQADYDGDGDQDIAVWQYNANLRVFENVPRDDGHWLELEFVDQTGADPMGIGAVVTVTRSDGLAQIRRVSGGDSAHSQSSNILHWGLGAFADPVDVDVLWPGGATTHYDDIPVDGFLLLDRATGVLDQEVEWSSVVYDTSAQQLTIEVKLRYGGRRKLESIGGRLDWDPDRLLFAGTFPVTDPPATVVLTNDKWGDSFELPVDTIP